MSMFGFHVVLPHQSHDSISFNFQLLVVYCLRWLHRLLLHGCTTKLSNQVVGQVFLWRHNERDGVSNHRLLDRLLKRFFRRRSNKASKFRVSGFVRGGGHRWPVDSPHKGPVTRKMFQFVDVIKTQFQSVISVMLGIGCVVNSNPIMQLKL